MGIYNLRFDMAYLPHRDVLDTEHLGRMGPSQQEARIPDFPSDIYHFRYVVYEHEQTKSHR